MRTKTKIIIVGVVCVVSEAVGICFVMVHFGMAIVDRFSPGAGTEKMVFGFTDFWVIWLPLLLVLLGSGAVLHYFYLSELFIIPLSRFAKYADAAQLETIHGSKHVVANFGNEEITDIARSFQSELARLRDAYDALAQKARGQTVVIGHDAEILRLLVDHIPLGVFLTHEPDGEILRINERAVELVGHTVTTIGAASGFLSIDGRPYPEAELPYRMVRETGTPITKSDLYFRYPDMRLVAFRMTSVPVIIGGAAPLYIITTIMDITDIKEVEQAKTDFVSLASHQLRTPIATINWYAELLAGPEEIDRLSQDQREYVQQILESGVRMARLIDTLLNASRIELGTFGGDGGPFDIVQVTDIALRDILPLVAAKHQKLEKNYDLSVPLIAGELKLGQVVIQNLLSNAVKYTREGGRIRVSVTSEDKHARIIVEDNGIGIAPQDKLKIFTRFYRAQNARDVDTTGSGLGLSIVRSLLERAGGSITFFPVPEGGTRFEVILPYTCKNYY